MARQKVSPVATKDCKLGGGRAIRDQDGQDRLFQGVQNCCEKGVCQVSREEKMKRTYFDGNILTSDYSAVKKI
jgi:hypothetical protein